jgi:cytidine deaminase
MWLNVRDMRDATRVASATISKPVLAALRDHARKAAEHNYARYSGLLVVAAVETTEGEVFGGTNVEVANYSLTKHAEEMAIMRALATRSLRKPDRLKEQWLRTLYVCGAAPCGSCRQFAWEWAAPDARCVIDLPSEGRHRVVSLRELLPEAFGRDDVRERRRAARPAGGLLPP